MSYKDVANAAKHSLIMLFDLPIGILLFTFAVTGLSLSAGLLPLFLLGIPLFIAVMGLAGLVRKFEHARCYALLQKMPPSLTVKEQSVQPAKGLLNRALYAATNLEGWKGIALMIVKLPLGIASFTIIVTLLSLSLGLLAYPLVYYILLESIQVDIYEGNLLAMFTNLGPSEASLIYFGIGILFTYWVIRIVPTISKAFLRVYALL